MQRRRMQLTAAVAAPITITTTAANIARKIFPLAPSYYTEGLGLAMVLSF